MKVVVINKHDVFGGAAKAAARLFSILQKRDIDVSYLVNIKQSSQDGIVKVDNGTGNAEWLDSVVQKYYINDNRTDLSNTWFSYTPLESDVDLVSHCLDADVINLHWVEQFVSVSVLRDIVNLGKPIVWTLHDTRPFTGGCHYPAGCKGFHFDCGHCIQLEDDPHRLPALQLRQKKIELECANVTIAAPSGWMAEQAADSSLFAGCQIEVIPNSLAMDIYAPRSKVEAKAEFGIASDALTLMCGAVDNREKRKGFHLLFEALQICLQERWFVEKCRQGKIVILVTGGNGHGFSELDIKVKETGLLSADRDMAAVYNATDLFVLPSLEDNLPNTVMEAMACGTPVISFETGGIPDLVQNGVNGSLAKKGDIKGLAVAILDLLSDEEKRKQFAVRSRQYIGEKFNEDLLSDRYLKLFNKLLSAEMAPPPEDKTAQFEHHDAVIGLSIKRYMEAFAKSRESSLSGAGAFDPDFENLIKLKESVGRICQYRMSTHPMKKYQAYRDMLKSYRNCKG